MLDKFKTDIQQKTADIKADLDKKKKIRRINREKAKTERKKQKILEEQAKIEEEKRKAQLEEEEKQKKISELEAEKNRLRNLDDKDIQVEIIFAIRGFFNEFVELKERVDLLSKEVAGLEEKNREITEQLSDIDISLALLWHELEHINDEEDADED